MSRIQSPYVIGQRTPSETLCIYRWNYLIVNLKAGYVRTCCLTPKQKIGSDDLAKYGKDVFLNTDYLKERRREMLEGIDHSDCSHCVKSEKKGVHSKRTTPWDFYKFLKNKKNLNENFKDFDLDAYAAKFSSSPFLLKESAPDMLEIVLGNHCDLKCTYCNHYYSSQWASELLKHGDLTREDYAEDVPKAPEGFEDTFWEWLESADLSSIRQLNILGGEPLIHPEFPQILDRLTEIFSKTKVRPELGIVTNFNSPPHIFDKFLAQIKNVSRHFYIHIQPSIEALHNKAEYIRFNLKFKTFERNLEQLLLARPDVELSPSNFYLSFQSALNTMSLSSLPEFFEWIHSMVYKHKEIIGIGSNIINDPATHNPSILTSDFSHYVKKAIEFGVREMVPLQHKMGYHPQGFGNWQYYTREVLPKLHDHLSSKEDRPELIHAQFADFVDRNDTRRGTDFIATFPEYAEFLEFCRSARMAQANMETMQSETQPL